MALCFYAFNSTSIPPEILDFKNNYENDGDKIEKLAHIVDSCSEKYANDPVFLEKKAQIFFQKGRNELKKQDYISSATSFFKSYNSQKAFIKLKNYNNNDDIHYLGQILENTGDVYAAVNSLKLAKLLYDNALEQYKNASLHHEVIDILLKTGDLYRNNHMSDIALLNYETAESKKNLTEEQYNTIQIKKGIALYDISDIESADSLYRIISTKSPHSIDYHYFAACYFYYSNNFKKALPHFLKCFEEGNAKMKLDASEMLASIYFSINDHDQELFYAQQQTEALKAEAKLTPIRVELDNIYERFTNENSQEKAEVLKAETPKGQGDFSSLAWILAAVILLLIIGIFILHSNAKKNKKASIIKVPVITDKVGHSFETDYATFVNTKIYKEIKESLEGKEILIKTVSDYPRLALTKVKLVTLTTKFNESFPNLTHTLSELFPSLTPSDFRFIIFSVMGFSDLEIAVLLKQTYGSANKRSNRIKGIFHTEEELENFIPNFLRTLKY